MKAIITIAYRHIIDASSQNAFDKKVWQASYNEYLLKSQAYNLEKKYKTFTELKAADGRANSLHYKSGFAIGNFVNELQNQIPVLQDTFGRSVHFETNSFEVIESDITNRNAHKVAVIFFTERLTLFNIIGEYMLLSYGDKLNDVNAEITETFMLQMQPNLSIVNYSEQNKEKLFNLEV